MSTNAKAPLAANTDTKEVYWYSQSVEETLGQLEVSEEAGLSETEAAARLERYGLNELVDKGAKNPFLILYEQLTDPLVIVLLVAAAVIRKRQLLQLV